MTADFEASEDKRRASRHADRHILLVNMNYGRRRPNARPLTPQPFAPLASRSHYSLINSSNNNHVSVTSAGAPCVPACPCLIVYFLLFSHFVIVVMSNLHGPPRKRKFRQIAGQSKLSFNPSNELKGKRRNA